MKESSKDKILYGLIFALFISLLVCVVSATANYTELKIRHEMLQEECQ